MLLRLLKYSEQAFVAVNAFGEWAAYDMWTGNRSMLCVVIVGWEYFGLAQES